MKQIILFISLSGLIGCNLADRINSEASAWLKESEGWRAESQRQRELLEQERQDLEERRKEIDRKLGKDDLSRSERRKLEKEREELDDREEELNERERKQDEADKEREREEEDATNDPCHADYQGEKECVRPPASGTLTSREREKAVIEAETPCAKLKIIHACYDVYPNNPFGRCSFLWAVGPETEWIQLPNTPDVYNEDGTIDFDTMVRQTKAQYNDHYNCD